MNWWVLTTKKWSVIIFCTIFFAACQNSSKIGNELQPQSLGVEFTEDVTLRTSTVLIDSVATTNREILLAGQYSDPVLGTVKASSYFALVPQTFPDTLGTLLSASILLPISYSYGDSTQSVTLNIHTLTSPLDTSRIYRSKDVVEISTDPFASKTFNPRDEVRLVLEIPIDPLKAALIFEKIRGITTSNLSYVLTQDQLFSETELKGFAISSSSGDCILGFRNADITMVFNHISAGGIKKAYTISSGSLSPARGVRLLSTGKFSTFNFIHVEANRTGTPLATLDENYEQIPSAQTSNLTYLQESLGIKTKVEFPNLEQELLGLGNITINKADLIIRPVAGSYSDFYKLPFSMQFWEIGENNRIITQAIASSIAGANNQVFTIRDTLIRSVQQELRLSSPLGLFSPALISFNRNTNSFNLEMSSYLQFILNGLRSDYTGANVKSNFGFFISSDLNLPPPNAGAAARQTGQVSRMLIGGPDHPTSPMKLRVFYTIIK